MNRVKGLFDQPHDVDKKRGTSWMEAEIPDCESAIPDLPSPVITDPFVFWQSAYTEALANFMENVEVRVQRQKQLEALTKQVRVLEGKLATLALRETVIAPLNFLAPEPYEVIKEIKVVIEQNDEEDYLATFYDANVNASGCTSTEAFQNLKSLLVSRFEYLDALPPEKLGPALKKQIAVLRECIRRRV